MNFEQGETNSEKLLQKIESDAMRKTAELSSVEVRDNGESLVDLRDIEGIKFSTPDMEYFCREQIFEKIKSIAGAART